MRDVLVGRTAEVAALRGHLRTVHTGQSRVVLVAGEAGVGKTALVEHVLAGDRLPVLRGRAGEWPTSAYDVLGQVLRAAQPLPVGPAELAPLLPELGPPPVTWPTEPADSSLAAALGSGLAAVAGTGGLVVVLDDLQWADEGTLALLPALGDSLRGRPVLLLGCYRSDELPRGHRLRLARAELRRRHRLAEIELRPLDEAGVRELIADVLGARPAPALVSAVADRAEGLPFAVEELAGALRDAGRLAYDGGVVSLPGSATTPLPQGIREAVALRVARLAPEARPLLEVAAVAGTEFDVGAVLAVADRAAWPEEELAGCGLVTPVVDGRAAFRHALTRDAVYADIAWSRRTGLHGAVAAHLTAAGAAPALVAAHLLAARDREPARLALLAAAEAHCAVFAYQDAARALRTALELWPAGQLDADRLAAVDRLALCAERSAEHAESVALLRELADGCRRAGDPRGLAGAYRRLALAHELLGHWESALADREAAAVAFGVAGLTAEAAVERLAAATHLRSAASYSAAVDVLTVARSDAEIAGREDLLARIDGLRGNLLARLGRAAEGVAAVRDALDRALAQGMAGPAAELQQRLADTLEHAGDYRAAGAAYASAYQFCEAHGEQLTGQICRACATAVQLAGGEWDRAADLCRDVLDAAVKPAHAEAVAAGILGLISAMRADPAARPLLLQSRTIAVRIELASMELLSTWGLAVLDDRAGAAAIAAGHAEHVLLRVRQTEECHYSLPILQWAATFFAERGAGDRTRACAALLARIAEATALPEARAALGHALGETALLAGQPAAAVGEFDRVADLFATLELPFATALAQRRQAAALARDDRPEAAVALLRLARRTSRPLRAAYVDDALDAALAALGQPPPRRPGRAAPAPAGLTRRELQVIRLVARGNTSREIASELFLSPRTVEMHVQNTLLKLDCRTRAEAVSRLAALGLAGAG